MTEDEAKTKWCPLVRFMPGTRDHHPMSTRAGILEPKSTAGAVVAETHCIGSACMAWRWHGFVRHDGKEVVILLEDEVGQSSGFCGLAGGQS